jgi:hypothetical protein
MAEKEYVFDAERTLAFTLEVQLDEETKANLSDSGFFCIEDDEASWGLIPQLVGDMGTVKEGDLHVSKEYVSKEQLNFDAVHSTPVPTEMSTHPMCVKVICSRANLNNTDDTETPKAKIYLHGFTSLMNYDGVSCLHTIFNVLQCLERCGHDASTVFNSTPEKEEKMAVCLDNYPFSTSNDGLVWTWRNSLNLIRQFCSITISSLLGYLYFSVKSIKGTQDGDDFPTWICSSVMQHKKLSPRVFHRYNSVPSNVTFRQLISLFEDTKDALGVPKVIATVNKSPRVAIAIAPSFAALHSPSPASKEIGKEKDKRSSAEARWAHVALPAAPPPPGGGFGMIANGVFFNNYGIHNPKLRSKVTDLLWDWRGLPNYFCPLLFVANVCEFGLCYFMFRGLYLCSIVVIVFHYC